jgi:putative membrane protein
VVLAAAVAACAAWAVLSTWQAAATVGTDALRVLWFLPVLVALQLTQLLISTVGWRTLLTAPPAGMAVFYNLRLVREGIDSLLPVAQVGGEVVGTRLLGRYRGITLGLAAASVVVDVTIEFVSQIAFLLIGLVGLAILSRGTAWSAWVGVGLLTAVGGVGLVMGQRLGLLRLIEALSRRIAARWPTLADLSLDGLHVSTVGLYRRRAATARSFGLHLLAWMLGTFETWAVFHALGTPATPLQALIVESLGMAARSAGFAVPGALVVQETGFVLAAAAAGLPEAAGLSLSLVKRVREVSVGLIGLALWRLDKAR